MTSLKTKMYEHAMTKMPNPPDKGWVMLKLRRLLEVFVLLTRLDCTTTQCRMSSEAA